MPGDSAVRSKQAPAPVGPYSQARWAGDMLYCSGQIGLDPASGDMVEGGVSAQASQAMDNLEAVLTAAGLDWTRVVKTTILLTDIADFGQVNQVYASFFPNGSPLPARTTMAVKALPKGAAVEIEVAAMKG